jgi:transposase
MPHNWDHIIGIQGIKVRSVFYNAGSLQVCGDLKFKPRCPHCNACGKKVRLKDRFKRSIDHEPMGSRATVIFINVGKYHCKKCRKYFREPIPGVLPYQRSTESFKVDVAVKHHAGISKDGAAKLFRISHSKVERCYKHVHQREVQERINKQCPRVLGIDEHFLNKKVGFITTLVDLKGRKVFDLLPGRSEQSLEAHLKRLKGRERVQVIVMDLSSTYRAIARKYFPNAVIVSDRFHVVKLINQSLMDVWKQFDEQGRKNRGLLSLMRRHRYKLSEFQKQNLQKYFNEHPVLGHCYHRLKDLKELMCQKMKSRKCVKYEMIPRLFEILGDLKSAPISSLQRLAKTIDDWLEPIGRMWRFSRTNSTTEGLHNKMEMLQRVAFGFHSFENYRIRVIARCG